MATYKLKLEVELSSENIMDATDSVREILEKIEEVGTATSGLLVINETTEVAVVD